MRNGRGGADRPRLALSWLAVGLVVVVGCWFGLSSTMLGRDGSAPRAAAQDVPPSASPTPSVAAVPPRGAGRVEFPPPGTEDYPAPIGSPPAVRGAGGYKFVARQKDGRRPVAYDPCRQVRFVIRPNGSPPGGRQVILDAIGRISAATGLQFVDEGGTDEAPRKKRKPYQPDRYGEKWAPVLIAWQTPQQNPDFATDVAGEAGSTPVGVRGRDTVYVTGQVRLDADKLRTWLAQEGGVEVARALILHELGHLVGLDHVADRTQVMNPEIRPDVTRLAPGDRRGLARLGQGACAPYL